ncbi:MAG: glycosyltransferase [Longimicrobiales bacterium]
MRVLHVPYGYFPDAPGGTEQYVAALAARQQARGDQVTIAAPAHSASEYVHNGLPVLRYPVTPELGLSDLWGAGDAQAAAEFGKLLERVQPELVHLHAYTSGVSLRTAQEIRSRRIPLVFTYHSPSVTCARGTLLRWGAQACSGVLATEPCPSCTLASYGVPRAVAQVALPVVRVAAQLALPRLGGLSTAARTPALVEERNRCVLEFLRQPARIMVPASWTGELLVKNGVNADLVVLVRHGLDAVHSGDASSTRVVSEHPLRVAFFGRLDPAKGAHLLIEALERETRLPVQLVLFGIEQTGAHVLYAKALRQRAGQDKRIELRRALPQHQVIAAMRDFDVVAVPSLVLETGPLVVLEAFAAHVPVLGTRLGGIAELVTDRQNGLLLEPRPVAWHAALRELVQQPQLLAALRSGIRTPRTLDAVVEEVAGVYQAVVR